jgi:hypothetical protein
MKNLIRKILKEDANLKVLKKHITKDLQKQVDSGEIPMLNYLDIKRKGLSTYLDYIKNIYFDFVGGEEEAFKLFDKYMTGKIITEDTLKEIGVGVHPEDHYKVKITRIFNPDYRGKRIVGTNEELEFGFALLDGQFITNQGVLSLEELYDDEYDEIWVEVTDHLRNELEQYVWDIAESNFFLTFKDCTSNWDD